MNQVVCPDHIGCQLGIEVRQSPAQIGEGGEAIFQQRVEVPDMRAAGCSKLKCLTRY